LQKTLFKQNINSVCQQVNELEHSDSTTREVTKQSWLYLSTITTTRHDMNSDPSGNSYISDTLENTLTFPLPHI